jgi:16S rRNA (uracil1498-N3)-methyltransferase
MNLVLLFEEDFVGGATRVRLTGRRLQHVRDVHRAHVGDVLRVGRLNDRVGSGRITALSDDALEMDVVLDQAPPRPVPLTLLLALPRPKSLKRVVQAVTAMGVKRIVLMNTWRVEKSFWKSPVLDAVVLREQLVLGLEQGRDTALPDITLRPLFKPFVEDELPALAGDSRKLLAHPAAARACPRAVDGAVTLAVGPEGGFIAYEIEMLERRGFAAVSLGERSLRVEHAVPALLGRLF